jgi:hypothetical protein
MRLVFAPVLFSVWTVERHKIFLEAPHVAPHELEKVNLFLDTYKGVWV